jgi:hypothetical protein
VESQEMGEKNAGNAIGVIDEYLKVRGGNDADKVVQAYEGEVC